MINCGSYCCCTSESWADNPPTNQMGSEDQGHLVVKGGVDYWAPSSQESARRRLKITCTARVFICFPFWSTDYQQPNPSIL